MLSFDGTIGRRTWWQHQIVSALVVFLLLPWLTDAIVYAFYWITPPPGELAANSVLAPTGYPTKAYLLTYPLTLVLGVLAVWIGFAATLKRVRHSGRRLWWSGLYLITAATNFTYKLLLEGGWPVDWSTLNPFSVVSTIYVISTIVLVVMCGVLNGTPAQNLLADEQETTKSS